MSAMAFGCWERFDQAIRHRYSRCCVNPISGKPVCLGDFKQTAYATIRKAVVSGTDQFRHIGRVRELSASLPNADEAHSPAPSTTRTSFGLNISPT